MAPKTTKAINVDYPVETKSVTEDYSRRYPTYIDLTKLEALGFKVELQKDSYGAVVGIGMFPTNPVSVEPLSRDFIDHATDMGIGGIAIDTMTELVMREYSRQLVLQAVK